jgi:hypothetical protein
MTTDQAPADHPQFRPDAPEWSVILWGNGTPEFSGVNLWRRRVEQMHQGGRYERHDLFGQMSVPTAVALRDALTAALAEVQG